MPKDKNNNQAMTEDEKFRSFFSTTAVNIPDEMTRRDEELPEEKPQKRFGLFARGKADQEEAQAAEPQEMPTGEVVLGGDAQPEQEADLELMLKPAADPEQELAPWPLLETEAEDAEPLRVDLPAPAPAKEPEPPRQSAAPVAEPAQEWLRRGYRAHCRGSGSGGGGLLYGAGQGGGCHGQAGASQQAAPDDRY